MATSALLGDQRAAAREESGDTPFGKEATSDWRPVRSSKEKLRLRLYAASALLDTSCIFLGFAAANYVRLGNAFHAHGVDLMVLVLPLYMIVAFNSRLFSVDVLAAPKVGMARAAKALALAIAAAIGTIYYLKAGADFSRVVMAVGTAASLALVCGGRWLFGHYAGSRHNWSFSNEVLLVDDVSVVPERGQIVLFAESAQITPMTDDPHMLDRLGRLLKHCDRVVVACPPQRRSAWTAMLKGCDVNVEVLAPELDSIGALAIGRIGNRSTVLVSHAPLGLRARMMKRAFDLALTLPALILLLPLFAVIAVAIKLDSPGPVFFRQPRTGRGNRLFYVLKFRSMHVEACDVAGVQSTARQDARITRIGALLRRTSIDELPQLLNVVRGEMSIVGPRPHALASTAEDLLFWNIDQRYWERHVVKPGITGLAQVRGFRGATERRSDLTKRLQADLEYLCGWSIWRDIAIVASTLRVMTHRNAF